MVRARQVVIHHAQSPAIQGRVRRGGARGSELRLLDPARRSTVITTSGRPNCFFAEALVLRALPRWPGFHFPPRSGWGHAVSWVSESHSRRAVIVPLPRKLSGSCVWLGAGEPQWSCRSRVEVQPRPGWADFREHQVGKARVRSRRIRHGLVELTASYRHEAPPGCAVNQPSKAGVGPGRIGGREPPAWLPPPGARRPMRCGSTLSDSWHDPHCLPIGSNSDPMSVSCQALRRASRRGLTAGVDRKTRNSTSSFASGLGYQLTSARSDSESGRRESPSLPMRPAPRGSGESGAISEGSGTGRRSALRALAVVSGWLVIDPLPVQR